MSHQQKNSIRAQSLMDVNDFSVNQSQPVSSACALSQAAVTTTNVRSQGSVIQTDNINLRTSRPSSNLAPVYVPTRQQQNHVPNNRPSFMRSQSDYQMQTFANRLPQGAPQMSTQNMLTRRRGIHSPSRNVKTRPVNPTSASTMVKSRLLYALLPSCFSSSKDGPLGLQNSGQNLCFMNSVLQCIANSPSITEHLYRDRQTDPKEAALTVAFCDLIKQLCMFPGELSYSVADSWKFRQAASSFKNSVISHPSNGIQENQDAAEFLTWLLDVLHTALNSTESQPDGILPGEFPCFL